MPMVDAKAASTMLSQSSQSPSQTKPLRLLTIPNRENTSYCLNCVILLSPNVLDFSIKIVIVHSLPYWISAQRISIAMFQS
jgi:hypothetical protein